MKNRTLAFPTCRTSPRTNSGSLTVVDGRLYQSLMKNCIKYFEMIVIRPLWIVTLVVAVVSLFRESCWLSIGCAIGLLCIGGIGSGMHPLQSARDLSQGPLKGPAAVREAVMLAQEDQLVLVRQACTKVGILIGIALFVVLLTISHWHWYWAALVAFFGCVNVAAVLRAAFCRF